jgi:hypothetical protein
MKWFAQHKILKLAAIFAMLVGASVAYISLQPDELTRYKEHLAAKGEELSLIKLSPPFSKEAVAYHQHFNDLVASLETTPIDPLGINVVDLGTGKLSRVAWDLPGPMRVAGNHTLTTSSNGDWAGLSRQIEASEPALSKLRDILTVAPSGSVFNQTDPYGYKSPIQFASQRKAAFFLAAAVLAGLHHDHIEAAHTNLQALIALARLRDEGGALTYHMIHAALIGFAISVTWESLQAPGWTEVQLTSLQSTWQDLNPVRGFDRTMERERAFKLVCYEVFRTNATECRQMFGFGDNGQALPKKIYQNLYLPIWANTLSKGDELRFLKSTQPMAEGIRHAITNDSYHLLRPIIGETITNIFWRESRRQRSRYPMTEMLFPSCYRTVTVLLRYETQRQMVLTAIALKRYQLKHGKLPSALTALTPEFLPSLPIDRLRGQLVTYQRRSDHRFTLRSVGDNGHDDQGTVDDLIWPEPEFLTDSPLSSGQ